MGSLFDPDGNLMNALGKMSDIVLCNILFCACCLPVFTIGAALTALHTAMQAVAAGTENDELGDNAEKIFLRTFKKEFAASTKLWLAAAAAGVFLWLYHSVVWSLSGALGQLYRVTFFLLLFIFLLFVQYIFPLQARFQLSFKNIIKNSFLLMLAALPWSLLALAIAAAAVYISFFMNPNGFRMAVFIWAVCGFGLVVYLDSFCYLKAFERLGVRMIGAEKEPGRQAENAVFTDEQRWTEDLMVQESAYSDPDWNRQTDPEEELRRKQHIQDTRGKRRG